MDASRGAAARAAGSPLEPVPDHVFAENGPCRMFRMRRPAAGLERDDLLIVATGVIPEGGELVVDLEGRVGRHGGGPVWGVIVGVVKHGAAPTREERTRKEPVSA